MRVTEAHTAGKDDGSNEAAVSATNGSCSNTAATTATTTGAKKANSENGATEDADEKLLQVQRAQKAAAIIRNFSPWQLVDPSQPWVLVDDGSFAGYFDWVPPVWRRGPWPTSAIFFFVALLLATSGAGLYLFHHPPTPNSEIGEDSTEREANFRLMQSYPAIYSLRWWYSSLACAWMTYIMYLVMFHGTMKAAAWMSYTLQSWTLLTLRHAACALAPLSLSAARLAEWTRFPAAASPTVTFVVWNFLLAPFIYVRGCSTPRAKRNFVAFNTSFVLVQLHVCNMAFCIMNVAWASPRNSVLTPVDFYLAIVFMVLYMSFYMLVLDRVGIHFYPIFSPRAPFAVVSWLLALGLYYAIYVAWKHLLTPQVQVVETMLFN